MLAPATALGDLCGWSQGVDRVDRTHCGTAGHRRSRRPGRARAGLRRICPPAGPGAGRPTRRRGSAAALAGQLADSGGRAARIARALSLAPRCPRRRCARGRGRAQPRVAERSRPTGHRGARVRRGAHPVHQRRRLLHHGRLRGAQHRAPRRGRCRGLDRTPRRAAGLLRDRDRQHGARHRHGLHAAEDDRRPGDRRRARPGEPTGGGLAPARAVRDIAAVHAGRDPRRASLARTPCRGAPGQARAARVARVPRARIPAGRPAQHRHRERARGGARTTSTWCVATRAPR